VSNRLGIIVETRYLRQAMPGAVIRVFRGRGIAADVICPRDSRFSPERGILRNENGTEFNLNEYDAIISRNRNPLGLAMLAYADLAGILTINSHSSVQRVRNKAKMGIALTLAGIRCAPTFLADHASVLAGLTTDFFPLILKATYGDNSQGLRLIRSPEDLNDLHWGNDLVLAQQFLPSDGFDLKLYVCGNIVHAVRKPSPVNGDPSAPAEIIRPDATMVDLALRCGEVFGLDIYGVDTIMTADGPVVIEVNDFPNFTGIPGADEMIADYILGRIVSRKESIAAERASAVG